MTSPHPTPILQTRHLTKVFRDFWRRPKVRAVDDLDLEVHPGEVVGILGPNGSGKSTAIKMILGLLHPTHGTIRVMDLPPESADVRARIGYLPELSHLYHYLTPRETLDFYGGLFDIPWRVRRERSEQLLQMVGLREVSHRPVGEFSKGMARRVGLAQALINNPDLVILDEPTSGLDPIGRHHVKELIRTLARQGKTILLSSHLLGEIEHVCDRVVILFQGRLQAEGRLNALLTRQEQTRINLPLLEEPQQRALLAWIAEQTGATPTLDHPSMTLEEFFLEVVARAEGQQPERTAPDMAPFLTNSTPSSAGSTP